MFGVEGSLANVRFELFSALDFYESLRELAERFVEEVIEVLVWLRQVEV